MVFGSTSNVALIAFDVSKMGKAPGKIELDGQRLTPKVSMERSCWLAMETVWSAGTLDPRQKSSLRGGRSCRRSIIAWSSFTEHTAPAMIWTWHVFVAEGFYYRGNGSIDVIPDTEFDANSTDRNVILFGNADTNSAWPAVLKDSPIQVANGSAKVGDHDLKGDDLAVLFLRPRAGSDTTMGRRDRFHRPRRRAGHHPIVAPLQRHRIPGLDRCRRRRAFNRHPWNSR